MIDPGSERPYDVRFAKNLLVPMRDGTRLAADLSVPVGDGPFPLILEYLPYRKDDWTLRYHRYFAEQGYTRLHHVPPRHPWHRRLRGRQYR